jgi:hypothetical protein
MTIPLNHPVVRDAAEVMAQEFVLMQREVAGTSAFTSTDVTVHARLLTDLSRPASRDWWVRWLASRGDDVFARTGGRAGARWGDLRDNATALTSAVMAALEGK